jgi:hypothetical protein
MLEKIKISNLIIISKNLLELNIFINYFYQTRSTIKARKLVHCK